MNRSQCIKAIMSADGIDDVMKAAAVAGIISMPKAKFREFSKLAERGLALLQAQDYDGLLGLLTEVDASPELIDLARGLLVDLRAAGDRNPHTV